MKYLLPLVLLFGGCATFKAEALPQAGTALNGVTAFYQAVCTDPLPTHAPACEVVKPNLNQVIEFYTLVNETFGEDE